MRKGRDKPVRVISRPRRLTGARVGITIVLVGGAVVAGLPDDALEPVCA